MSNELADRLNKSRSTGTNAGFTRQDGKVILVKSIEKDVSPFDSNKTRVKATVVDSEGTESVEFVTPTQASRLLEIEDLLPAELKVRAFPGQFNKTGYSFEAPNAE